MEVLRTLNASSGPINFGVPDKDHELEEMYQFRFETYNRLRYLQPGMTTDLDRFDGSPCCTYFVARDEKWRVVGVARAIAGGDLKVHEEFEFTPPAELRSISMDKILDFGRLVTNRKLTSAPPHSIALGLVVCCMDVGEQKDWRAGYGVVRKQLADLLRMVGVPVHKIADASLIYPRSGLIAPLYYDRYPGEHVPIWFSRSTIDASFRRRGIYRLYRRPCGAPQRLAAAVNQAAKA